MSKLLVALKVFCFVICSALLLAMMHSAWIKYSKKVITSGTRTLWQSDSQKLLPCLTFCIADGFKELGLHFTHQDFVQQTFDMEDIFGSITVVELQNVSLFQTTVSYTLVLGRCYTVCPKELKQKNGFIKFRLQRQHEFKLFIHLPGEEFWINTQLGYPLEMAFVSLAATQL